MRDDSKIDKIYQFLFISLVFIFPLTVSGGTIIGSIIIVLWPHDGTVCHKIILSLTVITDGLCGGICFLGA